MPRYYPNSHPQQLNDDLRILYDHVYQLQDQLATSRSEMPQAGKGVVTTGAGGTKRATLPEGGPSSTKIGGLNVKAVPPQQGRQVASLSGIPVLGYSEDTGEVEWHILP